jgi:hypothetical protein
MEYIEKSQIAINYLIIIIFNDSYNLLIIKGTKKFLNYFDWDQDFYNIYVYINLN